MKAPLKEGVNFLIICHSPLIKFDGRGRFWSKRELITGSGGNNSDRTARDPCSERGGSGAMRFTRNIVLVSVLLTTGVSFGASAVLGQDAAMSQAIRKAKILHPTAAFQTSVTEGQVVIQIAKGGRPDDRGRRVEAILLAKSVVNSAPGRISIIAVRYPEPNGDYKDILISSRDIISLQAGTTTVDALAGLVNVVSVGSSDSPETRFLKYMDAGERRAREGDLWSAECLFGMAIHGTTGFSDGGRRFAASMMHLGHGFELRGDTYGAERVFRKAVNKLQTVPAVDQTLVAEALDALAGTYLYENQYADAEPILRNLVSLQESLGDSAAVAHSEERLGDSLLEQQKYGEAEASFKKAVELNEQALGRDDPALLSCLEKLADCNFKSGRTSEAFHLYKRTKVIYDGSMVSKNRKKKIDYSRYGANVRRVEDKLKKSAALLSR